MSNVLRRLCLVLLLTCPLSVLASGPNLVLKRLDGTGENVSDFIGHGKWTVVVVWAHDCPVCNADINQVAFFHDEHRHTDATVLGVSIDGWAQRKLARKFIDLHALDFPNLIAEPDPTVLAKFGGGRFYGTPTFYIYSPQGVLMYRRVGAVTQEELDSFIKGHARAASGMKQELASVQ